MPRFFEWSLSFRLSDQVFISIPHPHITLLHLIFLIIFSSVRAKELLIVRGSFVTFSTLREFPPHLVLKMENYTLLPLPTA
jgi:hypothetical protein